VRLPLSEGHEYFALDHETPWEAWVEEYIQQTTDESMKRQLSKAGDFTF